MSLSERLAKARSGTPAEPESDLPAHDSSLPVWRPLDNASRPPSPETPTPQPVDVGDVVPIALGATTEPAPGAPPAVSAPELDDVDGFDGLPPLFGHASDVRRPDPIDSPPMPQPRDVAAGVAADLDSGVVRSPLEVVAGAVEAQAEQQPAGDPLAVPIDSVGPSVLDRPIHDVLADLAPPPRSPRPVEAGPDEYEVAHGEPAPRFAPARGRDPEFAWIDPVRGPDPEFARIDESTAIEAPAFERLGEPEMARPSTSTPPSTTPPTQDHGWPTPAEGDARSPSLMGRLAQYGPTVEPDTASWIAERSPAAPLPPPPAAPPGATVQPAPPAPSYGPLDAHGRSDTRLPSSSTGRARDAFPPLDSDSPIVAKPRDDSPGGLVVVEQNDPAVDAYYASLYLGGVPSGGGPTEVDSAARRSRVPRWMRWAERMTGRKDKEEAASENLCPACGGPASIDILDRSRGIRHMSCDSCFKMWQEALPQ